MSSRLALIFRAMSPREREIDYVAYVKDTILVPVHKNNEQNFFLFCSFNHYTCSSSSQVIRYPYSFIASIYTVEPQSYGLHSYGKLCQPDAEIEYIFGKYRQNFYKMGTGHQV